MFRLLDQPSDDHVALRLPHLTPQPTAFSYCVFVAESSSMQHRHGRKITSIRRKHRRYQGEKRIDKYKKKIGDSSLKHNGDAGRNARSIQYASTLQWHHMPAPDRVYQKTIFRVTERNFPHLGRMIDSRLMMGQIYGDRYDLYDLYDLAHVAG